MQKQCSTSVAAKAFTCVVIGLAVMAVPAQASLITGSVTQLTSGSSADLTALGTLDWGYFDTTASSGISDFTNQKNGASQISVSAFNGGTLRGSSSADTKISYSFSNGSSPASGSTATGVSAIFNTTLEADPSDNVGVQLTFDLPTTDVYTLYIWTAAFRATGTLTASLSGTTAYSDSTSTGDTEDPRRTYLYTLTAQANTAGDDVTVEYDLSANLTGSSSYVSIAGAAIGTAVPEASSLALFFIGATLVAAARKFC